MAIHTVVAKTTQRMTTHELLYNKRNSFRHNPDILAHFQDSRLLLGKDVDAWMIKVECSPGGPHVSGSTTIWTVATKIWEAWQCWWKTELNGATTVHANYRNKETRAQLKWVVCVCVLNAHETVSSLHWSCHWHMKQEAITQNQTQKSYLGIHGILVGIFIIPEKADTFQIFSYHLHTNCIMPTCTQIFTLQIRLNAYKFKNT